MQASNTHYLIDNDTEISISTPQHTTFITRQAQSKHVISKYFSLIAAL